MRRLAMLMMVLALGTVAISGLTGCSAIEQARLQSVDNQIAKDAANLPTGDDIDPGKPSDPTSSSSKGTALTGWAGDALGVYIDRISNGKTDAGKIIDSGTWSDSKNGTIVYKEGEMVVPQVGKVNASHKTAEVMDALSISLISEGVNMGAADKNLSAEAAFLGFPEDLKKMEFAKAPTNVVATVNALGRTVDPTFDAAKLRYYSSAAEAGNPPAEKKDKGDLYFYAKDPATGYSKFGTLDAWGPGKVKSLDVIFDASGVPVTVSIDKRTD